MYAEDDYLMLSGLQHFAYCRRQWALIHIEQQWEENERTVDGQIFHSTAHNSKKLEKRGDLIITRGLRIKSETLGVSGGPHLSSTAPAPHRTLDCDRGCGKSAL